ncbi:MAG: N-acetyltransferase [Ignavibacteriae bacterium HGW-Ignavibacteriae-3]|nr:MAG: N-acetyltransferase [Ignavibacteriae bacterium HGW-Ignavibacteriae-3]
MKQNCFDPFPILETERLYLRELQITDEQEVFQIRSDEKVREFLSRPKAQTIEDARAYIFKIINGIAENEWIYWVISFEKDSKFLGSICLWNISFQESKAEIGFELLPGNQRLGIITEALMPVISYCFNIMGLETIEAEVSPENLRSIKLLEKFDFIPVSDSVRSSAEKNNNTLLYKLSRHKN